MEYKPPPLPEDIEAYIETMNSDELKNAFCQYAEQAVTPLLAEIERLENLIRSDRKEWAELAKSLI